MLGQSELHEYNRLSCTLFMDDTMPHDQRPPGFTVRDEANTLVAWAFRNGPLETLHAGKDSPLLEDPSLSRITDAEMKELMLNACRMIEELLRLKEADPVEYYRRIVKYNGMYCRRWER